VSPDIIIVHKAAYHGSRRFEYWTGQCWTTVLRFAKTYSYSVAAVIMRRRFHRDASARLMPLVPLKKMRKEGEARYAD